MAGYFRINTLATFSPDLGIVSDKAFRLWVTAGCWCTQYGSLWVPRYALRVLRGTPRAAAELAKVGVWLADEVDGQTGWWFLANRHWEATAGNARDAIPVALRKAVLERDGHACLNCGVTSDLQMDHVYPWSRGGQTTYENLQTLCGPCNRAKGARI